MKRYALISLFALLAVIPASAQEDNEYMKSFEEFRNQIYSDYQNFLSQINEEYAQFLRQAWSHVKGEAPVPVPPVAPEPPKPPVVVPDDQPLPVPENRHVPIDDVLPIPAPQPVPAPIEPIREIPQPVVRPVRLSFYGTPLSLRFDRDKAPRLASTADGAVADFWQTLCDGRANNLIADLLRQRTDASLCDWAFFQLVGQTAATIYPDHPDERQLLQMFILCQSGFSVRIARDDSRRLHCLVATDSRLYGYPYFTLANTDFYLLEPQSTITQLHVCDHTFADNQSMRMAIAQENNFGSRLSSPRTLASKRYPNVKLNSSSNLNLIDFFATYPVCFANHDPMTKWWFYAMTPLSQSARDALYPTLRRAIEGKGDLDAVNILLNFVQTAFVYGYDEEVWGDDRAFFAEETLFYPFSDCEDRAILFSRLVRDLVGLDVALIYHPGHLYSAVAFKQEVKGDYITVGGRRFTIADPTYIGAPVGLTMDDMDNTKATAIPLQRN